MILQALQGTRPQWLAVLATHAVLLGLSQAPAQSLVSPGRDLPEMFVSYCLTRETALQRMTLAAAYGREGFDATRRLQDGCYGSPVVVRPLSDASPFPAYVTWVPSFDPSSRQRVTHAQSGRSVSIPISPQRQRVRMIVSLVGLADGRWIEAWVELPDRPYHAAYNACRAGGCD